MFAAVHVRKGHVVIALICVLALVLSVVWYRVDAASAETVPDAVAVPIIMYHSLLKEESRHGPYVISPQQFEEDVAYLQREGYTTIVMEDLLAYVHKGQPLPEKPVMLTFDDGYYNNYEYAFPVLQKYGAKMVLSPVGSYTDAYSRTQEERANYSYLTWERLREMRESGLVELQNHTYDMHASDASHRKGASKTAGETPEQYRAALTGDVMRMQERMREELGYCPTTFTYPFGAVSRESVSILKEMGFQATLVCESRINSVTRDPDCLYGLGRYLRPDGPDSATYFEQIVQLPV